MIEIRPYRPEDLEALRSIAMRAALATDAAPLRVDPDDSNTFALLIAERERVPVGFGFGRRFIEGFGIMAPNPDGVPLPDWDVFRNLVEAGARLCAVSGFAELCAGAFAEEQELIAQLTSFGFRRDPRIRFVLDLHTEHLRPLEIKVGGA